MANTAFETMYRDETVAAFERRQSLLRTSCTTEAMISGKTATFLVAGSGGVSAVTRGVNGDIPANENALTQTAVALTEWHAPFEMSAFNIFASQGDQRAIMQQAAVAVINRKIDDLILTELATATVTLGTATTGSQTLVQKGLGVLQLAGVPLDGQIMGVISPAFLAYLMGTTGFTSSDYVDLKPMVGSNMPGWVDRERAFKWNNINWIVHNAVPGVGTASESCFLYHRSAIGHAMNSGGMMVEVGRDARNDKSWTRASVYMGVELLQNGGVVKILHDGSAIVGS